MLKIPLQAVLLSIMIYALWGGNPVAGKFALTIIPPYWSAFFRFIFGILTIALWCRYRGYKMLPTSGEWKPLCLLSLLFTVQIGLMNHGFQQTSGVNSSILISTNSLFAALFAHFLIQQDRMTGRRGIGLLIGFTGVVLTLLATGKSGQTTLFGNAGDWLCLASAALLGFRLIASAKAMQNLDPFRLAMWQMILSLPLFALAGGLFETVQWHEITWTPVLGLAYQGVVVAGLGFMGSLWMISRYQPSIILSSILFRPLSGVLLSAWFFAERLTLDVLMGATLLVVGMILVCTASKTDPAASLNETLAKELAAADSAHASEMASRHTA